MSYDTYLTRFTSLGTIAAVLFCSSAVGQDGELDQETVFNSALTEAPAATLNAAPPASLGALWAPPANVLFDNGPLVNSPGTGVGGADESILQNLSVGMTTLGFGHQVGTVFRVADDFTVPAGGWNIDSFTFFAYETGSPVTSTMTAVNMRIWDGVPGEPGSNIVFGDTTTNVMTATGFTNIFRVTESTAGNNTARPIMAQTVGALELFLDAGTYWVDWETDGSPSLAGPWAPPITIDGQAETGNSVRIDDSLSWVPSVDFINGSQQGLPFVVTGSEPEQLSCEGFQFPMDSAVTIKRYNSYPPYFDQPSVLPLTIRLLDESGEAVYPEDLGSAPVVDVLFDGYPAEAIKGFAPPSAVPEELPYIGFGDDGNRFEFVSGFWRFNMGTREFGSTGTYYVAAVSGDPSEYWIDPTCVGTFTIINPFSWSAW